MGDKSGIATRTPEQVPRGHRTEAHARVVSDSVSPAGARLTTVEATLHRFVLAEINTHRVFSRNSASSRAIPVTKQLERVSQDPAWPVTWPAEHTGMQGGVALLDSDLEDAQQLFHDAHDAVCGLVKDYLERHPDKEHRLHKSLLNRLLEPFLWHTVVITSTEWDNFFALRCSPLAQPEIRAVAEAIRAAIRDSEPTPVGTGAWHTPYVDRDEQFDSLDTRLMVSAARCARVSYLTHDGRTDVSSDLLLFERLTESRPAHSSPLEHVATPAPPGDIVLGNFHGWHQYRHRFEKAP